MAALRVNDCVLFDADEVMHDQFQIPSVLRFSTDLQGPMQLLEGIRIERAHQAPLLHSSEYDLLAGSSAPGFPLAE